MKPISKDAIGVLGHFPVQWLAKSYSFHSSTGLQTKGKGPTLQMGTMLQLSMAFKILPCIRIAPRNNQYLVNIEHCQPVRLTGKDHMLLPVFQPLGESTHLPKEIHLVSVEPRLLLVNLRKKHAHSEVYISNSKEFQIMKFQSN